MNGFFQYYYKSAIITLIVVITVLIYVTRNHFNISISIISTIGIVLFVIDKWLWKVKPFSFLFWTTNFSGTYEGNIDYSFRDSTSQINSGTLSHTKVIHQTGSKIKICSFTNKKDGTTSSLSNDIGISVTKLENNQYQFIYSYLNDGCSELPPHYGTEIMKFISGGDYKVLSGRYFTERQPYQTRGIIKLYWTSKNQLHKF